jgi:hypothetical protein
MQYGTGTWPRQPHAEIVLVPRHPLRGGGGGGALAGLNRKVAAYAPLGAISILIVMAAYWVARPPEAVPPVTLIGCPLRARQCVHAQNRLMSIRMMTNGTLALDLGPSRSLATARPLTAWASTAQWVSDFRVTKTSRFASPGTRPPVYVRTQVHVLRWCTGQSPSMVAQPPGVASPLRCGGGSNSGPNRGGPRR